MYKTVASLTLALALWSAACGGGSSPGPTTPQPDVAAGPSPCAAMAAHMRDLVLEIGKNEDDAFATKAAPVIERVVSERCTADAWPAAVIDCATKADEDGIDPCIDQLSQEQQHAVENQIEKELAPIAEEESQMQAPAPAAPPPSKRSDDPCAGGA